MAQFYVLKLFTIMILMSNLTEVTGTSCSLPSYFGAGVVGFGGSPCEQDTSLADGATCVVKCNDGYESQDGSNFKVISCSSGSLSPAFPTCNALNNACTLPINFDNGVIGYPSDSGCVAGNLLGDGSNCFV